MSSEACRLVCEDMERDKDADDVECSPLANIGREERGVVGIDAEVRLACDARNNASADSRRSCCEVLDRDNEADLVIEADTGRGRLRSERAVELCCWLAYTEVEVIVEGPVDIEGLVDVEVLSVINDLLAIEELLDIAWRSFASLAARISALEGV